MKEIRLSNSNMVAIVDDSDFEIVSKYKWRVRMGRYTNYAVASIKYNQVIGCRQILMHRFILGDIRGMVVDHKNKNGLDNRRENIRLCTQSQNCSNVFKTIKKTSSIYKGVYLKCYRKWGNNVGSPVWCAQISNNGKRENLGRYNTEEEAAKAYNNRAFEIWGNFAILNKL